MKKLLLLLTLLFSICLSAQKVDIGDTPIKDSSQRPVPNLCGTPDPNDWVINGDFEQFSSLPDNLSQLERACNWINANTATPDYLHRNTTLAGIDIPLNTWGNQDVNPLYGGDAYAGMWAKKNSGTPYREIIRTQLNNPLVANTEYKLTFDVSLADNYSVNPIKFQAFLGSLFNVANSGELPILTDPNGILLNNTTFSSNTTGWDTVTFTFTTGNIAGQEYLYIGGIYNTVFQIAGNPNILSSYYYVDNVSLVETDNCTACNLVLSAQILERLWNTLDAVDNECGKYTFKIPDLEECFEIVINWGDGETDIVSNVDSGTILQHEYASNNTYSICTQFLVDGVACGREYCKSVIVDCFTDCPDCYPDQSAIIQEILFSTLEENQNECGRYTFNVPNLEECYEIIIDWGDGETNTVSTLDSGTILPHQYTSNDTYQICAKVLVDGVECGEKYCDGIIIDCFPNPSCNWLKSIGTTAGGPQEEEGTSVVVDSNGDVLLLGASLPNTNIEGTIILGTTYLAKYDPDGCFIWAKDISIIGVPVEMEINNNDELLILTKDNIGYNSSNNNYYLNKLDNLGNLIWKVTLTYSQAAQTGVDTVMMDLKRSTDEVFLLTTAQSELTVTHPGGTLQLQQIPGPYSLKKVSILKVNPNGNIGWSQTAYGLGHVDGYAITASENTNEVFVLGAGRSEGAGSSEYYDVIFRNNNTGIENTIPMVPNNYGLSVITTDFIVKFNSNNGAFNTLSCFPDWRSSGATMMIYNHNVNRLFVLDAELGPGNFVSVLENNLTPFNTYQYFSFALNAILKGDDVYFSGISNSSMFQVSKINSAGIVWEKNPINSFSVATGIAFNGDKVYTSGYFRDGNIPLGNGTHIDHIGGNDGFLTRLTDDGNTVIFSRPISENELSSLDDNLQKTDSELELMLFPNPALEAFTLKFSDANIIEFDVVIRNITGRIVLESKNEKTLHINSLPGGFYFVEVITSRGNKVVKRLIVN